VTVDEDIDCSSGGSTVDDGAAVTIDEDL
jgi:hypothetical protein